MNKLPLLSALNAPPIALAIYDAEERLSYWNRRVIEYYPGLESTVTRRAYARRRLTHDDRHQLSGVA